MDEIDEPENNAQGSVVLENSAIETSPVHKENFTDAMIGIYYPVTEQAEAQLDDVELLVKDAQLHFPVPIQTVSFFNINWDICIFNITFYHH